jgi:NADH-quinone oxidoreductase subunit D
MYAWRDREIVLDVMEALSGGRVSHATNIIGGTRKDITPEQQAHVLAQLDVLAKQVEVAYDFVLHERTMQARTRGVGTLSPDEVRRFCVVGPVARASGLDVDIRRDSPSPPYDQLSFNVPVHEDGDVWARTVVRMEESRESVNLCRQILTSLPEGPVTVRAARRVPAGEAISRSEAPRGEVFYYIRSDGTDSPARVKIRTPTLTSLITLPSQLENVAVADISVVLSGVDLCIACADR